MCKDGKVKIEGIGKIYEDYSEDDPTIGWHAIDIDIQSGKYTTLGDLVEYSFGDVLSKPVNVKVSAEQGKIVIERVPESA